MSDRLLLDETSTVCDAATATAKDAEETCWRQPPMLFPNTYVWLIFMSSLDVMLTWWILQTGGREVNRLANAVLAHFGHPGMVAFKFLLVLLVIVLCEQIGRLRRETGQRVAEWAVALTCVPVAVAVVQLLAVSW